MRHHLLQDHDLQLYDSKSVKQKQKILINFQDPFFAEEYTIIHSKWADMNPVFGELCSYIRNNGSDGFWYSTNCSDQHPVVCAAHVHGSLVFVVPGVAASTTENQTGTITKEPVTSKLTTYSESVTAETIKGTFTWMRFGKNIHDKNYNGKTLY